MHAHLNPHQDEFAELALKRVLASGAEYGDIRLLDSTTQTIRGEDRRIASIRESQDSGFGIRVLYHGAWGFAASSVCSLEEAPRVAELAIEIAKGSASVASERVKLPRSRFIEIGLSRRGGSIHLPSRSKRKQRYF